MNKVNLIDVFVCSKCGYEDSSFIPSGARHISCTKKCNINEVECPKCHGIVNKNIVQMENGRDMSMGEYIELVKYILENHSFACLNGKMIKYISNSFDTRTNSIYGITLDDVEFIKTNENSHRNLKKWIMEYLNQ